MIARSLLFLNDNNQLVHVRLKETMSAGIVPLNEKLHIVGKARHMQATFDMAGNLEKTPSMIKAARGIHKQTRSILAALKNNNAIVY